MRILVIGDERRVRSFLERGLSEAGFAVDVAADGQAGIDLALVHPYDAIVLDLMLPKKDGLSVLRELRAAGRSVPVLVLTARDEVEDRVRGLDAGADDYLPKPFAFADLLARLRAQLDEPGAEFASNDPVGLMREIAAARPERRLNVMLIVVESLSAEFLGAFGSTEGLTPNLDRLAQEGLLFTNLHATGTRTVRGLEAISLSVPPRPGYSIVKRPQNGNLFSLGTVFREHGYRTRFFYGGYSCFDNMGPFFAANGFDVIDRANLSGDEAEFANARGVADEFVFRRVLREARRSYEAGENFLSLAPTTSNHRPFTYPEGRIDIASGDGRAGVVKYNHIPMIVLAPEHIAPARVDRLASQMDRAPTLLELLGFSYRSRFFGRDILALAPEHERALLGTYQRLGYLKSGILTGRSPVRPVDVYPIEPDGRQTPVTRRTAGDDIAEAIAYYRSASAAFSHTAQQPDVERRSNAASRARGALLRAARGRAGAGRAAGARRLRDDEPRSPHRGPVLRSRGAELSASRPLLVRDRVSRLRKVVGDPARRGFLYGFGLGFSRVVQGAHFVSHNLWAALLCWTIALVLYELILRRHDVAAAD